MVSSLGIKASSVGLSKVNSVAVFFYVLFASQVVVVVCSAAGFFALAASLFRTSTSSSTQASNEVVREDSKVVSAGRVPNMSLVIYNTTTNASLDSKAQSHSYALYDTEDTSHLHFAAMRVDEASEVSLFSQTEYYVRENGTEALLRYEHPVDTNSESASYTEYDMNITLLRGVMMKNTTFVMHDTEKIRDIAFRRNRTCEYRTYACANSCFDRFTGVAEVLYQFGAHYNRISGADVLLMIGASYTVPTRRGGTYILLNHTVALASTVSEIDTYRTNETIFRSNTSTRANFLHDLDGDDRLDIILATENDRLFDDECSDGCDLSGGIYVMHGTADPYVFDTLEIRSGANAAVGRTYVHGFVWDVHAEDVNGDGCADILASLKPNSTSYEIHLYECVDRRTYPRTTVLHAGEAGRNDTQPVMIRVADLNGDGARDILFASTAPVLRADDEFSEVDFLSYEGSSHVGVIVQNVNSDGAATFDEARVMHRTEGTIIEMDVRSFGAYVEACLSLKTPANASAVECLRFA